MGSKTVVAPTKASVPVSVPVPSPSPPIQASTQPKPVESKAPAVTEPVVPQAKKEEKKDEQPGFLAASESKQKQAEAEA